MPGPSGDDAAPPRAGVLIGLLCLPLALGLVTVLRHPWWRDEAYTWLVVRAATSVADLVARLGFNGHPRAYYLLAYALYQISPSPLILSLTNLAFALLAIALFLRSAPFPLLHRALFSIGFFPLYQYGVIARSYSLYLFLLFLYAHLRVRWPTRVALRLLCLALLAQVHLMSLASAGVLLFLELVEQRRERRRWSAGAWVAAGVVLVSAAGAVYQILPRDHGGVFLGTSARFIREGLANAYFPHFDRLRGEPQHYLGLALFTLSWLSLSSARWTLLRYGLLCAPLLGISVLIYHGHRWHHGFYFIYFLVALWVGGRPPRRAVRLLGVVLALHAAVGAYALAEELRRPYSNGPQVARALTEQGLAGLPLVGVGVRSNLTYVFQIDELQPVLLALPAGRAYDPLSGAEEAYWRHYATPEYFTPMTAAELSSRLHEVAARLGSPLAIVTIEEQLTLDAPPAPVPPPLRLVAAFPEALDYGERMALYLFPIE